MSNEKLSSGESERGEVVARVLFVCLGNICRSPMAEAMLEQKLRRAGIADLVETDSAGTGDFHIGDRADPRTLHTLIQNGLLETPHRARQITKSDFDNFDYIITMDDANFQNVRALLPADAAAIRARIEPMLAYAPELGTEVPDPYYNNRFSDVYTMLDTATDGLLAALRARFPQLNGTAKTEG